MSKQNRYYDNMIVGHINNVFNNFRQSCTSVSIAVEIADYQPDCIESKEFKSYSCDTFKSDLKL